MYCSNCGNELKEKDVFCSNCGKKKIDNVETVTPNEAKPVLKCFTIFGKIGPIIGLVTFILAFVPFVNLVSAEVAVVGIVFCILGKKDVTLIRKCKKGLKFSIWAVILGFVLCYIYIYISLLGA